MRFNRMVANLFSLFLITALVITGTAAAEASGRMNFEIIKTLPAPVQSAIAEFSAANGFVNGFFGPPSQLIHNRHLIQAYLDKASAHLNGLPFTDQNPFYLIIHESSVSQLDALFTSLPEDQLKDGLKKHFSKMAAWTFQMANFIYNNQGQPPYPIKLGRLPHEVRQAQTQLKSARAYLWGSFGSGASLRTRFHLIQAYLDKAADKLAATAQNGYSPFIPLVNVLRGNGLKQVFDSSSDSELRNNAREYVKNLSNQIDELTKLYR